MKLLNAVKTFSAVAALTLSSLTFAADNININANDLAIHGYDPVSYFTKSKPVKGNAKYSATYEGAIYHFDTVANRDKFKANPTKYAPQFGGFCAMGIALNKKLDVDPNAWYIEDDKLYLNLNAAVQKKWLEDVPGNILTADRTWNGIQEVSIDTLNAE